MPFPLSDFQKSSVERHFTNKGDFTWTESFFLHVIDTSSSKYDLHKAAIGLREVGTEEAVEHLKTLLMYPNFDVQATAILTIAHLAGPRATPIFIEALENPAYRQKQYALWAIADMADARAIPHVSNYLARNSKRLKSGKAKNTPLLYIVQYAARLSETDARAKAILDRIPEVWFGIREFERHGITRAFPRLVEQLDSAAQRIRTDHKS